MVLKTLMLLKVTMFLKSGFGTPVYMRDSSVKPAFTIPLRKLGKG